MSNSIPPTLNASELVAEMRDPHLFRHSYESIKGELAKLTADDYLAINLDIPAAVIQVLGCGPTIKHHHQEVVEQLPKFDITTFDKIETYAMACGYAHTQFMAASAPPQPLQEMSDELTKLRELLVSDVTALAKRNLLDGSKLKDLLGPIGYKNVAFDCMLLAAVMRDNWKHIEGRTAVQPHELDRAEQLSAMLATAVGLRDQGPNVVSETSDMRQRAFTLFVNAYDEVRRVISYLRWAREDADTIAPSLYAGRNTGKKKADPVEGAPAPGAPAPGAPVAPTAPGIPAGVPTAPTATAPIGPVVPTAPRVAATAAPAGMPGNDPFGR